MPSEKEKEIYIYISLLFVKWLPTVTAYLQDFECLTKEVHPPQPYSSKIFTRDIEMQEHSSYAFIVINAKSK